MLDLQKLNKRPTKFKELFKEENLYLDSITSVDAQRHRNIQNIPTHFSVESFMKSVEDFLENKGFTADKYEVPSVSTVAKSFYVSNPYQGVTLSSMQLHAV